MPRAHSCISTHLTDYLAASDQWHVPIVDIELVGGADRPLSELSRALADQVGEALGARIGRTWIKLRVLDASCYAESGGNLDEFFRPVFVKVLERASANRGTLAARVGSITEAVARETGRPEENVHITFEPPAEGRQSFGGRLVE